MATEPTLARIWRARTRRADEYEPYLRAGGIPPLEETALGFQLFRAKSIPTKPLPEILQQNPAVSIGPIP